MDGDSPTAGDVPDNLLSRHRIAAFSHPHHHIVYSQDLDPLIRGRRFALFNRDDLFLFEAFVRSGRRPSVKHLVGGGFVVPNAGHEVIDRAQ